MITALGFTVAVWSEERCSDQTPEHSAAGGVGPRGDAAVDG